jgi:hypothetical protein
MLAISMTTLALLYYASLSAGFEIGMSIMATVMIAILWSMRQNLILTVAIVAFMIA